MGNDYFYDIQSHAMVCYLSSHAMLIVIGVCSCADDLFYNAIMVIVIT